MFERIIQDPTLVRLRKMFVEAGFDIRLVGGCVRDLMLGLDPKDIDLCTDATPQEQIAIYDANGVRHIPTGIDHGTITVVVDEHRLEITSLRVERDHDGRWATVDHTRDWIADLARRDLTINAMALTLDGVLVDPFGGADDLRDRRVVFVGDARERIREDYLRILRWFRFHGRFGDALDEKTCEIVRHTAVGLLGISRERVWSEVSRIISGPKGPEMMAAIEELGVRVHIDLPFPVEPTTERLALVHRHTRNPISLMVAYLFDEKAISDLADKWKWSRSERDTAIRLLQMEDRHGPNHIRTDRYQFLYDEKLSQADLVESHLIRGFVSEAEEVRAWQKPVFPVGGADLLERGIKPGREFGVLLDQMRKLWAASDATLTKETLLTVLDEKQPGDLLLFSSDGVYAIGRHHPFEKNTVECFLRLEEDGWWHDRFTIVNLGGLTIARIDEADAALIALEAK